MSAEQLRRFTEIDYSRDVAFVAVVHEDGEKREVGVSRYCLDADATSCECAVVVADVWQGRGLGTVLMRHLMDVARARGVRRMYSIDAAENHGMRELAAHLGFERRPAGGTLAAFLAPVIAFLFLLAALGHPPELLRYAGLRAFAASAAGKSFLLVVIGLFLWHAAHRLRVTLHDVGLRRDAMAAGVVYASAAVGTALTVLYLARV